MTDEKENKKKKKKKKKLKQGRIMKEQKSYNFSTKPRRLYLTINHPVSVIPTDKRRKKKDSYTQKFVLLVEHTRIHCFSVCSFWPAPSQHFLALFRCRFFVIFVQWALVFSRLPLVSMFYHSSMSVRSSSVSMIHLLDDESEQVRRWFAEAAVCTVSRWVLLE